MRLGVRLPVDVTRPGGVAETAERIEQVGWDSIWVTDHVVMTEHSDRSHYPFAEDGEISWDRHAPVADAVVLMAQVAAVTERVEIGTAVLVTPLRHPVVLAKQVATLDQLSGGRITLGMGVGWYREEYEALGVDFDRRGAIFDEWLEVMQACWTGRPAAYDGDHVQLPAGVIAEPTPVAEVPLLVGGVSRVALRRAAVQADGWLGLQRASQLDASEVAGHVARLNEHVDAAGGAPPRVTLRIIQSADAVDEVALALGDLAAAGVQEVIVDIDPDDETVGSAMHDRLRTATP